MKTEQWIENERSGEVLFGKDYSPALVKTCVVLSQPRGVESIEDRLKRILQDPDVDKAHSDYHTFSRVIEAIVIAELAMADKVVKGLIELYEEKPGLVPVVAFPTVLGFFNGLKHLDEHRIPMSADYVPLFCDLLKRFCFDERELAAGSDTGHQRGLLANAVALFVKGPDKKESGAVGTRRAHILNLLVEVDEKISPTWPLSNFGKILVDELCYKLYRTLSSDGRVRAFALLQSDLVSVNGEKV